jgi:hypothetical protein
MDQSDLSPDERAKRAGDLARKFQTNYRQNLGLRQIQAKTDC